MVSRLPFLAAVALVAAALADPVVETISNTGIFGGRYHDNNHLGVLPALAAGVLLAAGFAIVRCLDMWRAATTASGNRQAALIRPPSPRASAADLPLVFALQLPALFLLESCERVLGGGGPIGGVEWLGGPIVFSLAVHAAAGAGTLCALTRLLRATLHTFAFAVRAALGFVWLAPRAGGGISVRGRRAALYFGAPRARHIGGRAPPLLSFPA